MNYNKIIIKLFKRFYNDVETNDFSTKALRCGILMPNIDDELVDYAISLYGKDGELFNSTFHKDFNIVKNTNLLDLLIEQSLHYLTTYGTNFTSPYVYIPKEEVRIPNLDFAEIKLINICEIDKVELRNKIITLCSAALSSETVEDVVTLINHFEFFDIIDEISNKEVKCVLCSILGVVPSDPNEMLRYMIYLATGTTLKIKNQGTLRLIRVMMSYNYEKVNDALELYISQYGYNKLASIFITNKDLFLMFKNSDNASIMNKLNKLSKKKSIRVYSNKTLKDQITDTNVPINYSDLELVLNSLPIFKHMALLNTLNYISANPAYMEYRVRNGKSYFTEAKPKDIKQITKRRNFAYACLLKRVMENIENKNFYLPSGIDYTLPTSEKNFVGSIPNKSKITLTNNDALIVAIVWEKPYECDLDLSILDSNGSKIGWNGSHKTNNARTLFSGDMTQTVDGRACEAMFIDADNYSGNIHVNLYANRSGMKTVKFKLIIARADKDTESLVKNYVIDPNDVITTANLEIDRGSLTVGSFEINKNQTTFVFDLDNTSGGMVSYYSNTDKMRMEVNSLKSEIQLGLRDFLANCGGNVLEELPTEMDEDFKYTDLSLENISKETLFEIFS
jgi:hypothetical protein